MNDPHDVPGFTAEPAKIGNKFTFKDGVMVALVTGFMLCGIIGFCYVVYSGTAIANNYFNPPKKAHELSYEGGKIIHSMKRLEGWSVIRKKDHDWLISDALAISPGGIVFDSKEADYDYPHPLDTFFDDAIYIREAYHDVVRRLAVQNLPK